VILVKLAAGTSTCNKVMHDEKAAIHLKDGRLICRDDFEGLAPLLRQAPSA
jgi:hypothetical protein